MGSWPKKTGTSGCCAAVCAKRFAASCCSWADSALLPGDIGRGGRLREFTNCAICDEDIDKGLFTMVILDSLASVARPDIFYNCNSDPLYLAFQRGTAIASTVPHVHAITTKTRNRQCKHSFKIDLLNTFVFHYSSHTCGQKSLSVEGHCLRSIPGFNMPRPMWGSICTFWLVSLVLLEGVGVVPFP